MNFDVDILAKIVAPILSIAISVILKYIFEARPRVISFYGHTSAFKVKGDNPLNIFTHSVVIRNEGRRTACNLRVGHHDGLPENISITVFPASTQYTEEHNPEGGLEIVFPRLVPKEQITVSYLYFPPVTWNQINSYVKSDDGFAKVIDVIPMAQPSNYVKWLVWILMFFGASLIFYWLVRWLLIWIGVA